MPSFTRRAAPLACFIFPYSEFRNIPSCRFIPLPGADEIKRAELLNSEYSWQSSCRHKQKWVAVRLKPRASRGTHYVAAGPAIKNGRRNELQKRISRREDFKAESAPLTFLASLLIFRVFPKKTQARSRFGTPTLVYLAEPRASETSQKAAGASCWGRFN
jgi:hypothetical protein